MSTSPPPSKRVRTASSPVYELIYWPSIPGRGEHIRLAFEVTNTPYVDVANNTFAGVGAVLSQIAPENFGDATNPPPLAPPILKHGDLVLSQTPNILLYLGPRLGLAGDDGDENAKFVINGLALTALDGLSNEAHDTHHPIATAKYYEEQKNEANSKATDYLTTGLPKFLDYFERVLKGPASRGGEYLYGGHLTYADLVLFQCLDGLTFAFPKAIQRMKEGKSWLKVWGLYERVKGLEAVESYLGSERRLKYGQGIYRYYPELDIEDSMSV